MSQDLELEFGKEDVLKALNKLYEDGNYEARDQILKSIRETDEEVA
jgi:hypothetical protein